MLPPPSVIASRDARRLALVLQEVGGHGAPVGGGWMACDVPGSWATYAAGLGVHGPVPESELDRLVAWYRDQGRAPAVQITPYQDPSLFPALAARGFGPHEVETVLARMARPDDPLVSGLDFELVDPHDPASVTAFVDAQMLGFYAPDPPPPGIVPITARVARATRCRLWVVRLNGEVVASGGLESFENSAVLIAGAVLPHARRQGVQSAFIEFRVRQAAMQGIEYCLVGSLAGGPTERNALRAGFQPVYNPVDLRAPVRPTP